MPKQPRRWPNLERAAAQELGAYLSVPAFTVTPNNLADYPAGVVQISRTGGGGSDLDREIDLEVDTIHPTRGSAWDLAGEVQSFFESLNPGALGAVYIDECTERFGPALDSELNENFTRITATYSLTVRAKSH